MKRLILIILVALTSYYIGYNADKPAITYKVEGMANEDYIEFLNEEIDLLRKSVAVKEEQLSLMNRILAGQKVFELFAFDVRIFA